MNPTAVRSLPLAPVVLAMALAGCVDKSAPRSVDPAADDQAAGLRPMSSREAGGATGAAPTGEQTPPDQVLPPGHPPIGSMPPAAGGTADASGAVAGTIRLAPAVLARAQATDVLYLIARKDGAVIAVRRIESPTFPLEFDISSAHAMVAGTAFEGPLELVARLSHTGDAIAAAGDLEGTIAGVAVPSTGVTVTIDTVRQ